MIEKIATYAAIGAAVLGLIGGLIYYRDAYIEQSRIVVQYKLKEQRDLEELKKRDAEVKQLANERIKLNARIKEIQANNDWFEQPLPDDVIDFLRSLTADGAGG